MSRVLCGTPAVHWQGGCAIGERHVFGVQNTCITAAAAGSISAPLQEPVGRRMGMAFLLALGVFLLSANCRSPVLLPRENLQGFWGSLLCPVQGSGELQRLCSAILMERVCFCGLLAVWGRGWAYSAFRGISLDAVRSHILQSCVDPLSLTRPLQGKSLSQPRLVMLQRVAIQDSLCTEQMCCTTPASPDFHAPDCKRGLAMEVAHGAALSVHKNRKWERRCCIKQEALF